MSAVLPVSVVIPGYNAAAYLAAALESVGAQTQAPREVIFVDDGSSDGSGSIAERWGARVIVQRNAGVAAARNAGVRAATSDWIAFLDADDRFEPHRLATQWALGHRNPRVRLLASDYRRFEGDAGPGEPVLAGLAAYRGLRRAALEGGSLVTRAELLGALLERNFMLPSSWLVERSLFERDGVWFLERELMPPGDDFFIGEDYEWLLRALLHTDVIFAEEPLVAYRRSAASLSANVGRSRYGDAKLGDLVRAAPERYGSGAAQGFARVRPRQLRESAFAFLAAGDVRSARRRLREALGTHLDPASLALLAGSAPFALPGGDVSYRAVLAVWRSCVRPLVRAVRKFG